MAENVEKVAAKLKEIIDLNGMDYLTEEPYKVYQELLQSKVADRKTACLILYALMNRVQSKVKTDDAPISFSKEIQRICSLNKKAADYLSVVFLNLYSKENENDWRKKNMEGLAQFMAEEFECTWKGMAVWDAGEVTMNCYYRAEIILSPCEGGVPDKKLSKLLNKNPYMTKEAIFQYYEKELCRYLDREFEEYCTCDDYYEPVVEDFEIESYVIDWCKKHGFELFLCDGDGEDGGYEQKHRKGWY